MTIDQENPNDELFGEAAEAAIARAPRKRKFSDGAITPRQTSRTGESWWVGLSRGELSTAARRLFPDRVL